MTRPASEWRWQVGNVDRTKEHIEIRVGTDESVPCEQWTLVALVAPPDDHMFTVEFLITENDPANRALLEKARSQLQFYLIDLNEKNPWAYARYHCTTASNIYSKVQWSWHRASPRMSADS